MPVYNASAFLDDSIGSVLSQSNGDFELICFNDASTDNSADILRRYAEADKRIRIIDSPENVKQGAGRNAGISAARGRYIMFVDADDRLASDAVETTLATVRDSGSDMVMFDYSTFTADGNEAVEVCRLGKDAVSLHGDELRRRIALRTNSIVASLYERRLFTDNGLFFPEGVFYEDNAIALALQLSAKHPVKINRSLYLYRTDNQSTSRSNNDIRFFDRISSAVTLLGHLRRLGLYERFADIIDYVFINQYLVETVFGAIYRFDRVQTQYIKKVRDGVKDYVGDFRSNPYYRRQPLSRRVKTETHLRFPHLIKVLSNINRRLHGK